MPQRPTYIVTGGAGFVGSNLVAELLRREPAAHVTVIDNFRTGSYANIVEACARAGVGAFRGEVLASSATAAGGVDAAKILSRGAGGAATAFFHLGAITDTTLADESEMIRENVGSIREWLGIAASSGVPVVYASSAATYGTPPQAAQRRAFPEAAAGAPNNVYGFSKWLLECEHRRFAGEHPGAHAVGLRYFNVFGPGETRKGKMASMAYQLGRQMLAGQRPRLFTDGSQARDQVSVADVVDCTIAAAGLGGRRVTPGVYNLGSGVATTFNDVVDGLYEGLGIARASLPVEYFEMPASVRAFYQDFTLADMSGARAGLSWQPKVSPRDAVVAYGRWMRGAV